MMQLLSFDDERFESALDAIVGRAETPPAGIEETVAAIIEAVRRDGDRALMEYTARFDGLQLRAADLEVSPAEVERAMAEVAEEDLACLRLAAERIRAFHSRQKTESWITNDEPDVLLGQLVRPLERVGIYVPGGKASYPSSVLMNAIPAKVAGVGEVIMVVPMPRGEVNPHVLAAARLAGVDRIFRIGGAQAVAALAYGTATVPRVDKITGPGNIYVATAKKQVFGQVDIDMIAGPSEILVVNDGSGNAAHIAADLLSQAEHDELAAAILVTTDADFARRVQIEVETQLGGLGRQAIARRSIDAFGAIFVARDLEQAVALSNRIAPEHLELAVAEPFALLPRIHHAGAIFLGHYCPEALGDYLAGPNHTLPTGGTARFFSPLGVDDFVKKSSLISCSPQGLERLGGAALRLAGLEGLEAHGRSVGIRLEP
ncbi:histidinol dehydrogenase [Desulfuromonas sp. CSMB_57]|jgi:histidinol dehydrogenase|uniref:histidinol dehydrogenase n=1 Tax=Desulfuromonas sp. CSMB_57 TaxID=2807629 RepID=UPI001CD6A7D5|nr:histidinol dehydrogenase [Desulfuromonas sp. CSMB_57]